MDEWRYLYVQVRYYILGNQNDVQTCITTEETLQEK
jgi:hypothetical protein